MTVIPLLAPRSTTRDDVELVRACAEGDQLALAELHRRFAAQLWRFLSRLLGDAQEIEDLVQATFIDVWRGAAGFRGESAVKSWIFGIAHNKARRLIRGYGRKRAFLDLLTLLPQSPAPAIDDQTSDRRTLERVAELLGELSPEQRSAFVMVDLEGITTVEAARALSLRPGTLRRRLFDARRRLKKALTEVS